MGAESSISGSLCALCFVIITIITAFPILLLHNFRRQLSSTNHLRPPTPQNNLLPPTVSIIVPYSITQGEWLPLYALSPPIHSQFIVSVPPKATVTASRPFACRFGVAAPLCHSSVYHDLFLYPGITCLLVYNLMPISPTIVHTSPLAIHAITLSTYLILIHVLRITPCEILFASCVVILPLVIAFILVLPILVFQHSLLYN